MGLNLGGEDGAAGVEGEADADAEERVVRRGVTGWDIATDEEAGAMRRPAARGGRRNPSSRQAGVGRGRGEGGNGDGGRRELRKKNSGGRLRKSAGSG